MTTLQPQNRFLVLSLKFKSDIIFLDFVAVVNIVLPWIDFKAAMISSWWSIIVFSAWLQKMKIPQVQSDIDLEVVNSYTTDLSGIYNIITVDDKSTWVNDCKNTKDK
jgi:hypothetical protein